MSNPYQSPHAAPPYQGGPGEGDATGGVIPYKNMPALLAYYLGIASLLCCFVGVPAGIVPVVLGIVGLQRRAANPAIRGSVHAWIGIVLGVVNILASVLIIALALIGGMSQ
jgi:hypothetical protein